MARILLVSALPLALPLSCWSAGCDCSWLCPGLGALSCVAVATFGAAALLAGLSFLYQLAALESLRD